MSDEKSRFTSDRRGPGESSWSGEADWAAGTAENAEVVGGELVGRPPSQAAVSEIVRSNIFVGGSDDNLHLVDTATGMGEWSYPTGSPANSSPAVVDGVAYVGSYDGNLHAINVVDGTEKWTYTTGDSIGS